MKPPYAADEKNNSAPVCLHTGYGECGDIIRCGVCARTAHPNCVCTQTRPRQGLIIIIDGCRYNCTASLMIFGGFDSVKQFDSISLTRWRLRWRDEALHLIPGEERETRIQIGEGKERKKFFFFFLPGQEERKMAREYSKGGVSVSRVMFMSRPRRVMKLA